MQKFKTVATSRLAVFIGGVVLTLAVAWPLMGTAQDKSVNAKDPNQHAQHKDDAQHQATQPAGDRDLASQIAELRDKVARLEAAMAKGQPNLPSGTGGMAGMGQAKAGMQSGKDMAQGGGAMGAGAMPMGGKAGMGSSTKPMQRKMAGMAGMGAGNPPSGGAPGTMKPASGMGGMAGGASPPGGEMAMMMEKMMGMMDKMMAGMGVGAMPAAAPMGGAAPGGGMGGGMMGMGGGAPAAGAPMAGGGMGMGMMGTDRMEMAGMMGMMSGKGGSSMAMPSALPGFPGASHLYHVGATGFFLDHPQHIALSTEQQMMLNQIKEQAALDKAITDRSVQQAEQDLWTLTAADEPDNAQIETKVAEIEKLKGDARLRFIGAIGRAATILNDEQRSILTGFAPPVSAAPAAAPMAGGMQNM